MRLSAALVLSAASISFVACSSDPDPLADAGFAPDATRYDSGMVPDTGTPDAGRADTGPLDTGFDDPQIVRAGIEEIDGLGTYLQIHRTGTSTQPPIFILHRGPATSHEYLPPTLKPALRNRVLIFYDMRATGRSDYGDGSATSTVTPDEHLRDFAELVDFIDTLPENIDTTTIDIIGHEYGGAIGTRYAAANPARVSKLVLINPFPANIRDHSRYRGEVEARLSGPDRERYYAILNRPECFGDLMSCYLELWAIVGPLHMCLDNRDRFTELNFEFGSPRAERFFVDRALLSTSYDWRPELPRVTAETTVISGPCDPVPVSTSTTYENLIPNATRVILPDTGQFPMIEAEAEFRAQLRHAVSHP